MAVVLGWATHARAQDAPPDVPPEQAPEVDPQRDPFADVLTRARELYLAGEIDRATLSFEALERRLLYGEAALPADRADALIYLGEIRYGRGEFDQARITFKKVLEADPQTPINPYEHPPEVIGEFETMRKQVLEEFAARDAVDPPPYPVWGYLPFGVPQFRQKQPVRGATYLVLQGAFGAVSIWSQERLRRENGSLWKPVDHDPETYDADYRRINTERWLVQWPATVGFYATWAASSADGRGHFRATAAPNPGGTPPVLGVGGTF